MKTSSNSIGSIKCTISGHVKALIDRVSCGKHIPLKRVINIDKNILGWTQIRYVT